MAGDDRPPALQPRFPGILIAVVGPSGAGKDTVMRLAAEAFRQNRSIVFATRVISRPPHESEAHDGVDDAEFAAREAAGAFLIAWRAHGLGYALPVALADVLAAGGTVVANLSRGAVAEARALAIRVLAVEITADAPLLAARIAARGRENASMREDRLARNATYAESFHADIVISNNTAPEIAASRLVEVIRTCARKGPHPT